MIGGFVEVLFENSLRQIEIKEKMTFKDLIEELEIKETDPYWVACNRKIILKSDFGQKVLEPGDHVEIIRILSGGSVG
ncbi:MAG: sulfur carrier protein ThiS [Thermodesulfobacteriota bacterium]|nr:sulfur carrier protein ThiS [Thermodesulfobacteriota bacterium]